MKQYVLFYHNHETGESGLLEWEFIGDPFYWVFSIWESVNPDATFTLVEV
jgi:hypothetical protein